MTDQQQNGTVVPQRPEQVNVLLRSARAFHDTIIERDREKNRADHYERLSDRLEVENGSLRETVERLTKERDGYFRDCSVLRSQFENIGNAVSEACKSMMGRQVFQQSSAPTTMATTIDDGAPMPQFLGKGPREIAEEETARGFDASRFLEAITNGASAG